MLRLQNQLEKDVLRSVLFIVGVVAACRLTHDLALAVLVFLMCKWVLSNNRWKTSAWLLVYPLFLVVNFALFPRTGWFNLIFRIGYLVLAGTLLIAPKGRGRRHALPLGLLFMYLLCALVSSIGGYCFPVSLLKLVSFASFLICVRFGFSGFDQDVKGLYRLRCMVLALCVVIIYGSILTLLSPGIAYPQNVEQLVTWGRMTVEEARATLAAGLPSTAQSYLAGVTYHSNALAPFLSCCVGLVLCDMLFIVRKVARLHASLLILSLPLMMMTRSRGALVCFVAAVSLVLFYGTSAIPTPLRIKAKAKGIIMAFLGVAFCAALYLQVTDQGMSKWLRKTQNVEQDARSLGEAMTATRMGLVEENMADFYQNPFLGMGFQTIALHRYLYAQGQLSIFSAPIEKGVLPTMVLGESGLLGGFVFFAWLVSFGLTCMRRRYACTLCLTGVLMCTNMSEASFFSVGSIGGSLWMLTIVGGFVLDLTILARRQLEFRN